MGKHSTGRSSIPIFVGAFIVARVESGVFRKRVKGSKHFLADPRAIAFSEASIVDGERAGARELEIVDTETDMVYRTDLAFFRQYCFTVQRGFEPQLAMRLERWSVQAPKRRRRSAAGSSPITPEPQTPEPKSDPVQLNLFRR